MISVCIPTYEKGSQYLSQLLDSIARQRHCEFEIVVSDNSTNDGILDLCRSYMSPGLFCLPLRYVRNEVLGISNNTNNAIAHATSDFIKIMYQDDLLIRDDALYLFEVALRKKPWAVASYLKMDSAGNRADRRDPFYPKNMLMDRNTIGMPSVLGIRRNELRFDPNLRTRLDCEYYWLLHREYGEPEYIREPLIGCRYWPGSTSSRQGNCSQAEYKYLREKHGVGHDGQPLPALTVP